MSFFKIFFVLTFLFNSHCLGYWLFPLWQETTCISSENLKQENFNLNRFLGRWYETHHKNNNHKLFVEGAVIDFTSDDKLVKSVIKEEEKELNEFVTHLHLVYSDDQLFIHQQNDFVRPINDTIHTPITVVETDYANYAVLYSCLQPPVSNKCEEESQVLSVLSRSPHLGKTLRSYIAHIVSTKLCINLNDVVLSQRSAQSPLEDLSLVESSSCKISDIKNQENFSFKKFLGVWFNLAQSRIQESQHLDGAVSTYTQTSFKSIHASYFGYIKDQCIPPLRLRGEVIADHVPEFMIKYKLRNNLRSDKIRIVYTDYEDSAIVYVCYKENEDGTCAKHSTFIDFMSRHSTMTNQTREKLNNIIQNFCIQPEEVIDANYSVNCIPKSVARMLEEKKIKQVTKNEDKIEDGLQVPAVVMDKMKNNQDKNKMEIKNSKATLYIKKQKEFSDFEVKAVQIVPKEDVQKDRDQILTSNEPKDLDQIEDKVIFKDNENSQMKQDIKESDSSDSSSEEKQRLQNSKEKKNDEESTTTIEEIILIKNKNQKDESESSEEEADKSNKKTKQKNRKDKKDKNDEDKSNEDDSKNESNEDESNEDENKKLKQKNTRKQDKPSERESNEDVSNVEAEKVEKEDNNKYEGKKLKKDENSEDESREEANKQVTKMQLLKKNIMKLKRPKVSFQSKKLEKDDEHKQEKGVEKGLSDAEWFFMIDQQMSASRNCKHHYLLAKSFQKKTVNLKIFIPRCDSKGFYQPVQCNDNDECWCVNSDGITIPGSRRHVDVENIAFICDYLKKY